MIAVAQTDLAGLLLVVLPALLSGGVAKVYIDYRRDRHAEPNVDVERAGRVNEMLAKDNERLEERAVTAESALAEKHRQLLAEQERNEAMRVELVGLRREVELLRSEVARLREVTEHG